MATIAGHENETIRVEGLKTTLQGFLDRFGSGGGGASAEWFTGTAVSGTGTGISASVAGSKAGDMYLNTTSCNVYQATAPDIWDYQCNIKGDGGGGEGYVFNVPNENTKEFVEEVLALKSNTSNIPTILNFGSDEPYTWEGTLYINKRNVKLTGGGTIQGHLHIGYSKEDYEDLWFNRYEYISHHMISIENLTFNKYDKIGIPDTYNSSQKETVNNRIKAYLKGLDPFQNNDISPDNPDYVSISVRNVNHLKISNCFFDNVPYPIVYVPNTPNPSPNQNVPVNQNVRRLNIINCDFELCLVAVFARATTTEPAEYGDLEFCFNNINPLDAGLVLNNIDGLKIYNNVINSSAFRVGKDYSGVNVYARRCSQIVISNNSFYGEYNEHALLLIDAGNINVDGNTFASQHNDANIDDTSLDKIGCVVVRMTPGSGIVTDGINITNNLFSKVCTLPIYITSGNIRNGRIEGNTLNDGTPDTRRLVLYNLNYPGGFETENPIHEQTFLSDVFLDVRIKAICKYKQLMTLYSDRVQNYFRDHTYTTPSGKDPNSPGETTKTTTVKVKDIVSAYKVGNETKTVSSITVVTTNLNVDNYGPDTLKYLIFLFNGVRLHILFSDLGSTPSSRYNALETAIDNVFGSGTYTYKEINNVLYIKGPQSVVTPAVELIKSYKLRYPYQNTLTSPIFNVVYQNLGYKMRLRDKDGKNFVTSALQFSGFELDDNGKDVIIENLSKHFALKCTENGNKFNVYFRGVPAKFSNVYLLDDFYFASSPTTDLDYSATKQTISEITGHIYSNWFTLSESANPTIVATGDGACTIMSSNWAATVSSRPVDYVFLTDDGRRVTAQENTLMSDSNLVYNDVGTTAARPTDVRVGFMYFDTTLGKPIWWLINETYPSGTWVDISGNQA